jgi:hypothetical protein
VIDPSPAKEKHTLDSADVDKQCDDVCEQQQQ